MADDYRKALTVAEGELADVEAKLSAYEHRRDQLKATIAGLKSLLGEAIDSDESLTETIRTVLRGSSTDKYLSVDAVAVNARMLGAKLPGNRQTSVATILNRLVHNGEAEQGQTDTGYVGYRWKRPITSLTLRDLLVNPSDASRKLAYKRKKTAAENFYGE